ncbi:WD40 repeat domain-containing protein [Streptomyces sp. NPDC059456]|uniref:WD40 repeat domain-containing protein n=1 Tax=Streptomyces sp. NPDC059456 TaxID=3346838 RepID=UPI00367C3FC6
MSPDGSFLAAPSGSPEDGGITLWALPSGKELISVPTGRTHAADIAMHPDGRPLATSASDGKTYSTVQLWNIKRRTP